MQFHGLFLLLLAIFFFLVSRLICNAIKFLCLVESSFSLSRSLSSLSSSYLASKKLHCPIILCTLGQWQIAIILLSLPHKATGQEEGGEPKCIHVRQRTTTTI